MSKSNASDGQLKGAVLPSAKDPLESRMESLEGNVAELKGNMAEIKAMLAIMAQTGNSSTALDRPDAEISSGDYIVSSPSGLSNPNPADVASSDSVLPESVAKYLMRKGGDPGDRVVQYDRDDLVRRFDERLSREFKFFMKGKKKMQLDVVYVEKFEEQLEVFLKDLVGLKEVWMLEDAASFLFSDYEVRWLDRVKGNNIRDLAGAWEKLFIDFLRPHSEYFQPTSMREVFVQCQLLHKKSFAPLFLKTLNSRIHADANHSVRQQLDQCLRNLDKNAQDKPKILLKFLHSTYIFTELNNLWKIASEEGYQDVVAEALSDLYRNWKNNPSDTITHYDIAAAIYANPDYKIKQLLQSEHSNGKSDYRNQSTKSNGKSNTDKPKELSKELSKVFTGYAMVRETASR